jgi:hypothetical protein
VPLARLSRNGVEDDKFAAGVQRVQRLRNLRSDEVGIRDNDWGLLSLFLDM